MSKSNDWLVAGINNPDFTVQDFADAGLDTSNTQLLSKDEYLKSDFIKNKFTGDDGKFKQSEFDNFYNNRAQQYKVLQDTDQKFNYDYFDVEAKPGDKIKSPGLSLYKVANPDRLSVGISGMNQMGERKMSRMELAQSQKIYDPATGKFEDKSVNDLALTNDIVGWAKSLFDEPLVIALYDKDGEHYDPFTRQMVHHKKGDYKLNENGTYYTERLNGRSPLNKEVVSAFDYLTVDGVGVNKYDFFDSDDIEKNTGAVVMNMAANIAPLFLSGPAGLIFGGAMVAKETLKTLPMLYSMLAAFSSSDPLDSKLLNNLAAYGAKFSQGTSEKGGQSMWSAEGMANLITDVALQWGQLKAVANAVNFFRDDVKAVEKAYAKANTLYKLNALGAISDPNVNAETFERLTGISREVFELARSLSGTDPSKLVSPEGITKVLEELGKVSQSMKWKDTAIGKAAVAKFVPEAEKIAQRANKLGAKASLAYMAMVSNTDTYADLVALGLTKREAALVSLVSSAAMFGVDNTGLGEIFFDDLTRDTEIQVRRALAESRKSWKKHLDEVVNEGAFDKVGNAGKVKAFIKKSMDLGTKARSDWWDSIKYHTAGFWGKSVGEGIEEVSEELATDAAKYIYQLLGSLGLNTTKSDIGAFDNALERYFQSFVGGSIGGGIFYGVDAYKGGFKRGDLNQSISYLIRNGHKQELLDELEKAHDKGKLASKDLSWRNTTEIDDDKGGKQRIYLSAEDGESQNDFVYNRIKEVIEGESAIIEENLVGLDEDLLFLQMVLSDVRVMLLDKALQTQVGSAVTLKDLSYQTGYQQRFQQIISDLSKAENDYNSACDSLTGIAGDEKAKDEEKRNLQSSNPAAWEQRALRIQNYKDRVDQLKLQKDDFLSGRLSLDYTRMLKFGMDEEMNSPFFIGNLRTFVKQEYNADFDKATELDKLRYLKKYEEWKKDSNINLVKAWQAYKEVEALVLPDVQKLSELQKKFKDTQKVFIDEFFDPEKGPLAQFHTIDENYIFDDERLANEGLSDEEILNKINLPLEETATDDEKLAYTEAKEARNQRINAYNEELFNKLNQALAVLLQNVNGKLDLPTLERLRMALGIRTEDRLSELRRSDLGDVKQVLNDNYGLNLENINAGDIAGLIKEGIVRGLSKLELLETVKDRLNKATESVKSDMGFVSDLLNLAKAKGYELNAAGVQIMYLDMIYTSIHNNLSNEEFRKSLSNGDATIESKLLQLSTISLDKGSDLLLKVSEISDSAEQEKALKELLIGLKYNIVEKGIERYEEDCTDIDSETDVNNFSVEFHVSGGEIIMDTFIPITTALESEPKNTDVLLSALLYPKNLDYLNALLNLFQSFSEESINNSQLALSLYITDVYDAIENDPMLLVLQKLNEGFQEQKSPVQDIIERLAVARSSNDNISNFIRKFNAKYRSLDDPSDFVLDPEDLFAADEFEKAIRMVQSVLYASSTLANIINPTGHNAEINTFVKNHPGIFEDFEELPTLDPDVAQSLLRDSQLMLYALGIKYLDGSYNINSWRYLALTNYANKAEQIQRAQWKWNSSISKTIADWKNHPDSKELKVNGKTYNIFSGITSDMSVSEKDPDGDYKVSKLLSIIRDNFYNALKDSGLSIYEFMKQSNFIVSLFGSENSIKDLLLNSGITEDLQQLTAYDLFTLLATVLAMSDSDFKKFALQRVEAESGLVPVIAQIYAAQQTISLKNNGAIWEAMSQLAAELYGIELPILKNTTIITGNGGSGKTSVVAKYNVEYTKKLLSDLGLNNELVTDRIWLSGPGKSLIDNLAENVGNGTKISLMPDPNKPGDSILEKIVDDPAILKLFLNDINNNNRSSTLLSSTTYRDVDDRSLVSYYCSDEMLSHIKIDENFPSEIVIDETTYIPTPIIHLLSEAVTRNRTENNLAHLTLVGDIKQNGSKQMGASINRQSVFALRCNELKITLRDCNTLQAFTVKVCGDLIDQIETGKFKTDAELRAALRAFRPKVYLGDTLNGTLITASITDDVIKKIPKQVNGKPSKILFVGEQSSPIYKMLEEAGLNPVAKTLKDVQGDEGDYVVTDYFSDRKLLQFKDLTAFYTILTRGKVGSVFVGTGTNSVIGQNDVEEYLALAPSIKDAIEMFKPKYLEQLNKVKAEAKDTSKEPTGEFSKVAKEDSDENKKQDELKQEEEEEKLEEPENEEEEEEKKAKELLEEEDDVIRDNLITDGSDHTPINRVTSYSDLAPTGLEVTKTDDGKYIYTAKDTHETRNGIEVVRDLEAFVNPGQSAGMFDDVVVNATQLHKNVRDMFLYAHGAGALNFDALNKAIPLSKKLNEGSFNNLHYYVELREADGVNFVYGSGVSDSENNGILINNKKYIAAVVVDIPLETNDSGAVTKVWTVTLSLLSDPQTELNNISKTILWKNKLVEKLKARLATVTNPDILRNILNEIDRLEKITEDSIKNLIASYKSYLDDLARKERVEITKNAIKSTKRPWIQKAKHLMRTGSINEAVLERLESLIAEYRAAIDNCSDNDLKIRLQGTLEYYEKQRDKYKKPDRNSFKVQCPNAITSKCHVLVGNSAKNIQTQNIKGKRAVIFATTDSLLGNSDLALLYEKLIIRANSQLANTGLISVEAEDQNAAVTMMLLNNLGIDVRDWVNCRVRRTFGLEGKRFTPYKLAYVGTRLYSGLWNFRASLINFINTVNEELNSATINADQLNDALIDLALHLEKGGKFSDWEPESEEFKEAKKFILKVNDNTLPASNIVRSFRLGGVYKTDADGNRNPFYLGNIKVNDDICKDLYPNIKPGDVITGTYMSLQVAQDILLLFDNMFKCFDGVVTCTHNGNRLDPSTFIKSPDTKLYGVTNYKNANAGNSFEIDGTDTPIEIKFGRAEGMLQNQIMGAIPELFTSMLDIADHILSDPDEFEKLAGVKSWKFKVKDDAGNVIKDDNGKDKEEEHSINFGKFMKDGLLNGTTHTVDNFYNIVALALHGTSENIYQFNEYSQALADDETKPTTLPLMLDSAAPFPHGMFVDPLTSEEGKTANFKLVTVNPYLFGVDGYLRGPVVYLDFDAIKADEELKKEELKASVQQKLENKLIKLTNKLLTGYNTINGNSKDENAFVETSILLCVGINKANNIAIKNKGNLVYNVDIDGQLYELSLMNNGTLKNTSKPVLNNQPKLEILNSEEPSESPVQDAAQQDIVTTMLTGLDAALGLGRGKLAKEWGIKANLLNALKTDVLIPLSNENIPDETLLLIKGKLETAFGMKQDEVEKRENKNPIESLYMFVCDKNSNKFC